MNEDAIETLRELITGLELTIELEGSILNHLQPDMEKFNRREPYDQQRVRQYLSSRDNIIRWKKELAAFAISLNQLKREP